MRRVIERKQFVRALFDEKILFSALIIMRTVNCFDDIMSVCNNKFICNINFIFKSIIYNFIFNSFFNLF